MLKTLNGVFSEPKPHRINFIKENKKKLKETSNMVYQSNLKSRVDITKTTGSQTEVTRSTSESSAALKENKKSSCRLSVKGSAGTFHSDIRDKGNSNQSITATPQSLHNLKLKNSQRLSLLKHQSCQTIDPRRCDQLFHEGVIKYPSNKIMQELAEIEKRKANRLDAHVKKEYFKRNKIHQRSSKKLPLLSLMEYKKNGKGDEFQDSNIINSEDEKEEEEKPQEEIQESEPEPEFQPKVSQKVIKPPPQQVMRAAEIIRKTTEDINNTKTKGHTEFSPNNKIGLKTNKTTKKIQKEDEILKTVLDPQCPPGHIPLPDTERKKTLYMLRVSHAELVREMNLLPVRTDTLRVRQKKINLENQLNKIEEGIKVFSKSKVYVKIEE